LRLPLIAPTDLTADQRALYDDMRAGITANFKGITAVDKDGAVIGPFNPWLQEPRFGGPIWDLTKALASNPTLPRPIREVAILVVGARFRAAYEIYAHVVLGERVGLPDDKIATIVAGQRPSDLTREEAIAYDVASALVSSAGLPEINYRQASEAFGPHGAAELIYLVGFYCIVSVTLNGFDVPVPDELRK
jgi:alkylhydroperoxidase family enzyme